VTLQSRLRATPLFFRHSEGFSPRNLLSYVSSGGVGGGSVHPLIEKEETLHFVQGDRGEEETLHFVRGDRGEEGILHFVQGDGGYGDPSQSRLGATAGE